MVLVFIRDRLNGVSLKDEESVLMPYKNEICVVVPVFNEEAVLPIFLERIQSVLRPFSKSHKILFVDDGSTDRTLAILQEASVKDERLGVISFSRNFGHQSALCAGLSFASAKVVAIIDGDLQDPPELIPQLFDRVNQGDDVVYAVRRSRRGNLLKRVCYWVFYRVLKSFAQFPIPLDAGDFCAMSDRVVKILNAMPEQDRFLRGMRAWVGFRQSCIEYDREVRFAGSPKYDAKRLFRLAVDGILSSSDKPLRMATVAGFFISMVSFLFALYFIVWKIFVGGVRLPGYASIAAGIFFLGGVQLLAIGILGEYIARIFNQVKSRPLFVVDKVYNLLDSRK